MKTTILLIFTIILALVVLQLTLRVDELSKMNVQNKEQINYLLDTQSNNWEWTRKILKTLDISSPY